MATQTHLTPDKDTSTFAAVSEIAANHGLTIHAVYKYVRKGLIPSEMIDRSTNSMAISRGGFRDLMRSGALLRHGQKHQRLAVTDDNKTTRRDGDGYRHRWIGDDGRNVVRHPWEAR